MKILLLIPLLMFSGCTMVSNDRVFPKLTWYWQWEAVAQRKEKAEENAWAAEYARTNKVTSTDLR